MGSYLTMIDFNLIEQTRTQPQMYIPGRDTDVEVAHAAMRNIVSVVRNYLAAHPTEGTHPGFHEHIFSIDCIMFSRNRGRCPFCVHQ